MKEREILFENRYEVDRELYDRWRRLGLVQSRGALFFRFVWAGLLVLVTVDFFRNLFFGINYVIGSVFKKKFRLNIPFGTGYDFLSTELFEQRCSFK